MGIIDSKTGKETRLSAEEIRKKADEGRAYALMAIHLAGSGHPGGSLSIIDAETALYFNVLRHDPKKPDWRERDRLFVSAQHKCPAQYALMGLAGYYPVEAFVVGLRAMGTPFQGHPDWLKLKGIEMSGGSLGQGLSIAVGDALAAKLDNKKYRVYCLMGDGEQQEGSVWEAAMSAAHYKLDNICAFVDLNGLQIDGKVCEVMDLGNVAEKYRSFGWNAIEVDGHNHQQILDACEEAKKTKGKPTVIVLKTIKGKGVSFMENNAGWHGKAQNLEQTKQALKELGFESLFTEEIQKKAKALREKIAKEYGNLISKQKRPHWWNSEEKMNAEMAPTRKGFGSCLARIGGDERIVALGADISGSICILDFCSKNPERNNRFISMGIAEQNMTTAAAGLAKEGKIPVIGSYGVFVTGRNWDQLRTTVCYGNLNVKIAVGHGGVSVGPDGATHQSLEDLTLLTILPNMKVMVPCDSTEADKATEEMVLKQKGPVATRFAREATPIITTKETPFVFGKANVYRFRKETDKFSEAFECFASSDYKNEGEKATIIACGPEVPEALRAAYILKKEHGIETRVINMHTIKPLDEKAIIAAAKETGAIVTAEEHQAGGVGNQVAGVIARAGVPVRMAMIGVKDRFGESAEPWELVWKYGLAAEQMVEKVKELLK
ncbi:transketolase [Candidatus Micrarchaeota archaeon]|nr:transketolase [Candidatus Micrarchaeota archaeon]